MNDTDQKTRRFLLKPLVRTARRRTSDNAYLESLRRLDERAIGEDALQQLRAAIEHRRSDKSTKSWKDPVRAKESVQLAKALYASRRISRQQYVYYAVAPVENVHEGRWMDGYYDIELGPIREAIDRIEQDHGLTNNEYWPARGGPVEHVRLNEQYEALLEAKFKETLNEFDLPDLLGILESSREAFDLLRERGRRSVFHDDEYALTVKDAVVQLEGEARKAATVGAYSAAITSLGAGVEGLLLLRCLRSSRKASRIAKQLPKRLRPRSVEDPSQWTFETLIEVCLAAGWLPPIESSIARYDTAGLAHILRSMRNYVHPGKFARQRPWSVTDEQEYRDAEAIYHVMLSTIGDIPSQRRRTKVDPAGGRKSS